MSVLATFRVEIARRAAAQSLLFAVACWSGGFEAVSVAQDKKAPAAPPGPLAVNRAKFIPAPDRAAAMVGGKFSGSNVSSSSGFVTLGEIKTAPQAGQPTELALDNAKPYRWVRYEAPVGSHGAVAEIELYAGDKKLGGGGFGSPGGAWRAALDGKPETWFNAPGADGQFVGLDLGAAASTRPPALVAPPGDYETPQRVAITCPTPGAVIRYTLDGTTPGPDSGIVYTAPLTIDKTTTLVAVAQAPDLAPSPTAHGTYQLGKPLGPVNSFHVGNSLTGNTNKFPMYVRTAGRLHRYESFLIGGSLTVRLWNASHNEDKARWETQWGKASLPLEHFTLQPRDFNVPEEVDYAIRFIKLVRETSPHVQPWLYSEWVERPRQRPTDKGEVASSQMSKVFPARTWEESMSAMLLYNEEVRDRIHAAYQEGKPTRIIPASLAMGRAANMIDRGELPGVSPGIDNLYATLFEDQVHVNPNGSYLVDMVWYSAFYGESPEGKVLPIATTLTAPQAATLQRLAWDVVQNYPDCGWYVDGGSTPVGKPRFSVAPGPLSETVPLAISSSTPGAWFRYTLDGTTPTRTRGYVSCGVVSVRPGMTVKAIAYKSGMADSEVVAGEYPQRGPAGGDKPAGK